MILRILTGAGIVLLILTALSLMNRGDGSCGGNCGTCSLSEHCEKAGEQGKKLTKISVEDRINGA